MKFIIDKKIYDTEKAELIIEYTSKEPNRMVPQLLDTISCELYITKKGNWFEVSEKYDKRKCKAVEGGYVKSVFRSLNNVVLFDKYFKNELEEA